MSDLYNLKVETIQGVETTLDKYKGKTLLIVNIASKCGYTPQLLGLEKLYKKYKDKGLEILGFPCNQFLKQAPGTNTEIMNFCQSNYGVTFDVFGKLNVKGREQSSLYKYLIEHTPIRKGKKVKWNFEKFLVNQNGEIINRYLPKVTPEYIEGDLEEIL
jgi:glutathione peroxidase